MFRGVVACALVALLVGVAGTARAAYGNKDIQEVENRLKAGKGFYEGSTYPNSSDYSQWVHFNTKGLAYGVDFRPHLCFAFHVQASMVVPCTAIKNGYPEIGKLITWDKDGFAQ
jgi:hypothetical protein